ncbi:GNAT family N-acetyltransferase [Dactylosporangium fulvum]|uniref:GNAT family N-acetyltransferase n=1 Tax=Dactylosporangium fulvum TaxID=53359 RepID=A0ABY5WCP2_9ACTN|nr:GNAT family N-acetyltransferase [Dactylosporangium fulvum]UWP86488.1 GNAT family N-acetyltransferase [Dactylosporangium fulvum]
MSLVSSPTSAVDPPDPPTDSTTSEILDSVVWAALTGPHHRPFAEIRGQAARYHPDVAPFVTVSGQADERVWDDLAGLVGPGATIALTGTSLTPPDGWDVVARDGGVQLVDVAVDVADDPEAVPLTAADVPEILALIERTKPGPFRPRTIELGTYLGIRRDGALVAMAGERLHPPGWTEISAVCTDPAHRGQGLATRLVRAVAAGIRRRGETPFLHAAATNTNAIRLYESIGFKLRRRTTFSMVRVPENQPA